MASNGIPRFNTTVPAIGSVAQTDLVVTRKSDALPGEFDLTPIPTLRGSTPTLLTGADAGTQVIPITTGTYVLTKGSAGAYTLAAPTALQNGTRLTVTAGTAFAHTITATALIEDGVTGGAKTTATFAAFVGATIILEAYNLKWHTVSLKAVTVA